MRTENWDSRAKICYYFLLNVLKHVQFLVKVKHRNWREPIRKRFCSDHGFNEILKSEDTKPFLHKYKADHFKKLFTTCQNNFGNITPSQRKHKEFREKLRSIYFFSFLRECLCNWGPFKLKHH